MRGIIFTLDALLALVLSLLLIGGIFQLLESLPSPPSDDLQKLNFDSLAVMEKLGILASSVEGSSSLPLQQFGKILPQNICYRLTVSKYPSDDQILADENCGCKTFSVAVRSFIVPKGAQSTYLANMRSCYKGS